METNQDPKAGSSTPQTTKTIPSRSNGKTLEQIENEERKSQNVSPFSGEMSANGGQRGSGGSSDVSPNRGRLDFDHCVQFLNQKGQEQFGQHFAIHPADYEIIFKLLVYAIKDQTHAAKFNINLHKGILLSGPVGCGKTTLMTLTNHFYPQQHRFVMKSCREISFEFIKDGYETIQKYTHLSYRKNAQENTVKAYCFDDLGVENSLKYFGNECNVMAEILLSRYDLFVQRKMFTHITTNLSATEIENLYGSRVRSRMREMFNLIAFGRDCRDKRG